MVAAKQFKYRFAAYLQPPPGSTNPPTQPDGSPWPVQVGVACSSGLEFTTHSVRAVLDENPDCGLTLRLMPRMLSTPYTVELSSR